MSVEELICTGGALLLIVASVIIYEVVELIDRLKNKWWKKNIDKAGRKDNMIRGDIKVKIN